MFLWTCRVLCVCTVAFLCLIRASLTVPNLSGLPVFEAVLREGTRGTDGEAGGGRGGCVDVTSPAGL